MERPVCHSDTIRKEVQRMEKRQSSCEYALKCYTVETDVCNAEINSRLMDTSEIE